MTDPRWLLVSHQEREQVVEILGQAVADGRLTLDEYGDRCAWAYAARTRGDLAETVAGLPVDLFEPPTTAFAPVTAPLLPGPVPAGPVDRVSAVFGDDTRKGRWLVPPLVEARAVFGECRVELQDAQLQQAYVILDVVAICGRVHVVVPMGAEVRMNGWSIVGGRECKLRHEPVPGGPVIEVRAYALLGGIDVRSPSRWWEWRHGR
jgi:hypothetical protein